MSCEALRHTFKQSAYEVINEELFCRISVKPDHQPAKSGAVRKCQRFEHVLTLTYAFTFGRLNKAVSGLFQCRQRHSHHYKGPNEQIKIKASSPLPDSISHDLQKAQCAYMLRKFSVL
ncbi:hypothetical protein MHYP_G00067640 [Metynnis hypsauchen]